MLVRLVFVTVVSLSIGPIQLKAADEPNNKDDRKTVNDERPRGRERGLKKGPFDIFEFIRSHENELGITEEQKNKFKDLNVRRDTQREKMKADPQARELFKQMLEAKNNQDQAALESARKQLRELTVKLSKEEEINPFTAYRSILSKEQTVKIHELLKAQGIYPPQKPGGMGKGHNEKQEEGANKPDPDKGAPSIFEQDDY